MVALALLATAFAICEAGHSSASGGAPVAPSGWGPTGSGAHYLRDAARGYANQWYASRNGHFNDFTGSGGDCANFVSQCLIAGGLSLWQGTNGAGYGVYPDVDRPTTYSNGTIPYCDYLHQHLTRYQPVDYTYVIEGVNASIPASVAVGDAVFFGEHGVDRYKHAMLVVWVGAGDVGLAAHTTDTYNASFWGVLGGTSFTSAGFYHIRVELSPHFPFVIKTGVLNVRCGPGLNGLGSNYQDIGDLLVTQMYVAYGTQVDASGNLWFQFWFDERNAWCAADMASGNIYAIEANQPQFEVEVSGSLNVRDGSGTANPIAGQVYDGARYVPKLLRWDAGTARYWRSFWWGGMVKWCAAGYTFNASQVQKDLTRLNVGFYPSWMGSSYLTARQDLLTHICWFSVEMNSAGDITAYNSWPSGWTNLVRWSRENGTKVLLTVTLFGSSSVSAFLASTTARANGIANLLAQTVAGDADGIMVDFEYPPSGSDANLLAFMQELAAAFNAENALYEVHLCLMPYPWSGSYGFGQLPAINTYVDYYFLMGYDYFYGGSGTTGAVGALFWNNNIDAWHSIDRWINVYGADRHKLVYGVSYFGFDWPVQASQYNLRGATTTATGSSRTYNSAMTKLESTGATLQWDAFSASPWYWYYDGPTTTYRQVWFDNATSLKHKYQAVNELDLPGMGIWALAYDDPRAELWGAIDEKLTEMTLSTTPANGSAVSGAVNVTLKAVGGLTDVWVKVPGDTWLEAAYTTNIHTTYISSYYRNWDTTALATGWYTVQFRMNNSYGRVSFENRSYFVDNGAAYFNRPLTLGWNLVSFPLVQADTSVQTVLESIAGKYDRVMWYNPRTPTDRWWQYNANWPAALNDLKNLNHTMGFWLNVTTAPATLNVTGTVPSSTGVPMRAGWNQIGYPAQDDTSYTVGQLKAATGATFVEGFNATATYKTSVLQDTAVLKRGRGYWVYVVADTVWTVNW
jgi:spore germination protein YaaH